MGGRSVRWGRVGWGGVSNGYCGCYGYHGTRCVRYCLSFQRLWGSRSSRP